jgi:hypothetical protein
MALLYHICKEGLVQSCKEHGFAAGCVEGLYSLRSKGVVKGSAGSKGLWYRLAAMNIKSSLRDYFL